MNKHIKALTVGLPLALLAIIYIVKNNSREVHTTDNEVHVDMYLFFTELLKQKYALRDEAELYQKFLNDYFLNRDVELPIDSNSLSALNKRVLKRDTEHYYHYYSKLIEASPDSEPSDYDLLKPKNPEIPFVIYQTIHAEPNSIPWEEAHTVHLNTNKDGYLYTLKQENIFSADVIAEHIENVGELSMLDMASLFVKGKGGKDLKHKEVRQLVAVVFWKLLCLHEKIDFHAP